MPSTVLGRQVNAKKKAYAFMGLMNRINKNRRNLEIIKKRQKENKQGFVTENSQ